MPIQAINNANTNSFQRIKSKVNSVSLTGYGALVLGTASAIAGNRKKIKMHKYLAYIAGALAFVHTGIIEFNHYKRRQNRAQNMDKLSEKVSQ